jgi:hypothetical protein
MLMDAGPIGVVNPPDPSASGRSVHDDVGAGYPLGGVVLHPGPRDRKHDRRITGTFHRTDFAVPAASRGRVRR